jgi:hypothetical protein
MPKRYRGGAAVSKAMGLGAYGVSGIRYPKLRGLGSYDEEVQDNALIHGPSQGGAMDIASVNPTMMDDSGDVVISHKEFVRNIVVNGEGGLQSAFALNKFPINPGLQESFPFLSQLAQNFTMYSMEGCMFQYKPLSGEGGGVSNQLGKVIMTTDYDPQAEPFINSIQMENYQYSQSAKPSMGMRHGVECKKSQGTLEMQYVRTGASTRDKAWTDLGLFQVATEGIPLPAGAGKKTMIIGELWVTYRIRLSRANLYSSMLGYNIKQKLEQKSIANSSVPVALGRPYVMTNTEENKSNLDLKIGYYRGLADSESKAISIEWPKETILGTFKVTIIAYATNSGNIGASPFLTYWSPTYIETQAIGDTVYDVPEGEGYTQWGSVFLPELDRANGTQSSPKSNEGGLDLTTGLQKWDVIDIANQFSPSYTRCTKSYHSSIDESFQTTTTVTYFSINSPGITVPRLTLIHRGYNNLGVPSADGMHELQGVRTFSVAVEQVNSTVNEKNFSTEL